jgi:rhamnose utilization protein RhaD (predicted bifunctional aldolase and dehydrogenase)
MTRFPEMKAFLGLSARIGSDPLLVQASSGNTSFKVGGLLWIKASGKWLSRAMDEGAFVPLPLAELRSLFSRNEAVSAPGGPSIETAMHALISHRVVIHVHSVNTIAWAVRRDGERQLSERLAGLNWRWIPYVASGLPLAQAIDSALTACPKTNVFVLANHGLVVCEDDCSSAENLLARVESCLSVSPRGEPQFSDPVTARILQGGILYPCQAMFLGTKPLVLTEALWNQMTDIQRTVLDGLLEVVRRIDESAPIRYLSEIEVNDLLTHDVHRYIESVENNAVKAAAPSAEPAVAHAGN